MRRWVCPTCGSGVNGPERPRRDDVRRYCLDCSAKTGRLVERTSPALTRQRAAGAERSAAKARAKSERERRARHAAVSATVTDRDEPIRVDKLLDRAWALPTRKAEIPQFPLPPTLKVQRGNKEHSTGRCWYGADYITVTIGRHDYAEAVSVVIHEAAHEIAYRAGRARHYGRRTEKGKRHGQGHGTLWRSITRSLVGEWSGVAMRDPGGTTYEFQQAMAQHLREHPGS
jgi:hypothetical protein